MLRFRRTSLAFFSAGGAGYCCCIFSSVLVVFSRANQPHTLAFCYTYAGTTFGHYSTSFREVFLRLFHCCFGVFSLLCGLFQGGTALQTLCFCPIYPLLQLEPCLSSLLGPFSSFEDTFSRSFLALSHTFLRFTL